MTASGKRTLALSLLIALATMPDAIVPIALKSAVVDRWHVSMSMATWFAAASLLGAVLVLPMLRVLDRRFFAGLDHRLGFNIQCRCAGRDVRIH